MNYKQRVEECKRDIQVKQEELSSILKEWAENECPVSIGDIVEVNDGYSYKGKKMVVTEPPFPKLSRWKGEGWFWCATGKILKKDGSEGLLFGKWKQEI